MNETSFIITEEFNLYDHNSALHEVNRIYVLKEILPVCKSGPTLSVTVYSSQTFPEQQRKLVQQLHALKCYLEM